MSVTHRSLDLSVIYFRFQNATTVFKIKSLSLSVSIWTFIHTSYSHSHFFCFSPHTINLHHMMRVVAQPKNLQQNNQQQTESSMLNSQRKQMRNSFCLSHSIMYA